MRTRSTWALQALGVCVAVAMFAAIGLLDARGDIASRVRSLIAPTFGLAVIYVLQWSLGRRFVETLLLAGIAALVVGLAAFLILTPRLHAFRSAAPIIAALALLIPCGAFFAVRFVESHSGLTPAAPERRYANITKDIAVIATFGALAAWGLIFILDGGAGAHDHLRLGWITLLGFGVLFALFAMRLFRRRRR